MASASEFSRRPNPRPFRELANLDDVDAHRRVDCAEYAACLKRANLRRWLGWTCDRCPVRRPLPVEERARDVPRLCRLGALIPAFNEVPANDNECEPTR